jgi:DNA-binding Xre family transcriptional regulator
VLEGALRRVGSRHVQTRVASRRDIALKPWIVTNASKEPRKMTPIGQKVRELRLSKKMTSLNVAEKGDLSFSLITQLETGRRKYLTADNVERLAVALDVPSAELWALIPGGKSDKRWIEITD